MTAYDSEPGEGEVLADKYRVDRVLGRGGMGVVLAAKHLVLGHEVAIKLLSDAGSFDPDIAARFLREAQVTARLKSAHVAKTLDMGQLDDGRPFIVMELLAGHDLGVELERRKDVPIAQVVEWILQASEGLAEAHAAGVVHRDLKPTNLFLTRDATGTDLVKVLDFGVSKLVTAGDGLLTTDNAAFGTPLFMSPEQMASPKDVDARSDVWSLGVILYLALSGQPPFTGKTLFALGDSVRYSDPIPIHQHRPDVPPALSATIMRCLAKNAAERWQSVADLADALVPFAGPMAAEQAWRARAAFDPSTPRRLSVAALGMDETIRAAVTTSGRPGGERRIVVTIAAILAALVFAAGVLLFLRSRRLPVSTAAPASAAPASSSSTPPAEIASTSPVGSTSTPAPLPVVPPAEPSATAATKKTRRRPPGASSAPARPSSSSPFIDQRID